MRLAILLLLCTVVRARIIECDPTAVLNICLGSEKKQGDYCSFCDLKNQQISESDEVIFILHPSDDLEVVSFTGGEVTKLPNIIRKADNKEFLKVLLSRTKTRVLNSQFFGNASENLNHFGSKSNNKLSVEAFAFQNCTNLEHLDLSDNKGLSIISPDAFRGLDNLVELNLGRNELSLVLADWFEDLGNLEGLNLNYNRLAEIPDRAFKSLTKLQWLILDQNYIEIITKTMFKHNDKLQAIIFSRNRINQIQLESFAHLSQLNYLDLGENSCVDSKFINKTSEEIGKRLSACYVRSACVIPQIKNGFIVTIDYNSTRFPGDLFEDSGKVKVVCNSTFTQIHDKANQTTNRCVKEDWGDPQWPTCQRLCPRQEIIDESFLAFCDRNGEDFPCSSQLLPGIRATIRCQTGFMNPKGLVNTELICEESGNWSQSAHKCEPAKETGMQPSDIQTATVSCSHQEISDISITSYCERNNADVNCTGHLAPGTKASIRCHFGYQEPRGFKSDLICQKSGNWSSKVYKCEPVCGRVARHSIPLQIGGQDTNVTEVPWHVGIYEKDIQICGGTIISERVVISAAHCFSQKIDGKHDIDYNNFKVAAGKIVRGLYENETQKTQIRDVLNVEISQKYDGNQIWWADIAAIITKGHFEYQLNIAPACVNFTKNRDDWYPKESKALVAGWGLNKNFLSSETLQSFDIPVVDYVTCVEDAPQDFKDKVVDDKICAGFVDPTGNYSKVVCKGDSGGGLLISQTVGPEKRYFLQGVVSNSQSVKKECDTSFYTLFTNIQYYKNPIIKALKNSRVLPVVAGQ